MRHIAIGLAAATAFALATPLPAHATTITLGRFFGACEDAGTDTKTSVGEACIIQSIINAFSAADNGVTIETLPTDWGNYYDQIKAAYAGGTAPDIHVLHKSHLTEFASLHALADVTDDLPGAGIDTDDWVAKAKEAVTYDGRMYAVPMDIHANLWHANMGLLGEAGLVKDGKPVLPTSPEELLSQAKQVKEKTGKNYLAADFAQFPIGVRLVLSLMWQQGGDVFTPDGTATVDSPEALTAAKTITQLFDGGYADPKLNYADSEKAFLNGDAAVLVNGTWVVDSYTAQAKKPEVALDDYYISDFPQLFDTEPATWADSHMWGIPANLKANDPEKYEAAVKFMAFLLDHDVDWARTGHLAIRKSVLASEEYKNLPHRAEYAGTAKLAHDVPQTPRYGAIQDVLNRHLQSIWLTGADPEAALDTANGEVQDQLDK